MKASAQYINQSEVGDKLAGEVDGQYAAVKLGAGLGALSGYVAYSTTDSSNTAQANVESSHRGVGFQRLHKVW